MRTITEAHLKQSGDLSRVREVDVSDKFTSFDVAAIFTNVLIDQANNLLLMVINDDRVACTLPGFSGPRPTTCTLHLLQF